MKKKINYLLTTVYTKKVKYKENKTVATKYTKKKLSQLT